jgi:hypothetical protein
MLFQAADLPKGQLHAMRSLIRQQQSGSKYSSQGQGSQQPPSNTYLSTAQHSCSQRRSYAGLSSTFSYWCISPDNTGASHGQKSLPLTGSRSPSRTACLAYVMSERENSPESIPCCFHMYTPSATPKANVPSLHHHISMSRY